MGLKHIILLVLFFSCSFTYSQTDKINSLNTNLEINVYYPFTSQELSFIENAFDDETLKRINKIKPLEKYVKDVLRNRVQILNKKHQTNENLPKLSSVSTLTTIKKFNTNNFNPLLYNFDFDSQKSQIYRVDGTDIVINIIPKERNNE